MCSGIECVNGAPWLQPAAPRLATGPAPEQAFFADIAPGVRDAAEPEPEGGGSEGTRPEETDAGRPASSVSSFAPGEEEVAEALDAVVALLRSLRAQWGEAVFSTSSVRPLVGDMIELTTDSSRARAPKGKGKKGTGRGRFRQ